jgi:MoxR-like ATPase
VQFTPDLLPSDVTGAENLPADRQGRQFQFQKGPIFANLVLADEINRAPAKVQSALLEAMEERQVTVAGKTYKMPDLSWCWPRETRSSRRAPIRFPRRSSIAS